MTIHGIHRMPNFVQIRWKLWLFLGTKTRQTDRQTDRQNVLY